MGVNLKRKAFAVLMSLALVVSMSSVVFAAGSPKGGSTKPATVASFDTTTQGTTACKVVYSGNAAAKKYIVAYKKTGGKYKYYTTTSKSKVISGLTPGGTYVFAVAAVNGAGKKSSYKYTNYSYRFMRAVKPTAKRGKGKITVKWKKAKGSSGYQIRYSYKKNLAKYGKIKSVKAKTLKKKIKGKKGKKIYYQVRPYKIVGGKKYVGSWSKVKYAKAK